MDNRILDDIEYSNGKSKPKEADLLGLGNVNPAQTDTVVTMDDEDEGEDLELLMEG